MSTSGHRSCGGVVRNALCMALCMALYTAYPQAQAQTSAATESVHQYAIPAGPLSTALSAWGAQSDRQLVFAPELAAGKQSRGVSGSYRAEEALARVLDGTGLTSERVNGQTYTLKRSLGTVPAGLVQQSATAPRQASNYPPSTSPAKAQTLQGVVVTGIRGMVRTATDSPAPIDVITSSDILKTGEPDALNALKTLIPSFTSPTRAGGGTASVIATGSLRGLNPDQMLVLVNGHRRHKTSLINAVSLIFLGSVPSDLSLIPVSAIDHIEVLRDGAAAKYGSDAIAGVVNVILKQGQSNYAAVTGGRNHDRSDGDFHQADLRLGQTFGTQGSFFDFFLQSRDQSASNRAGPVAPNVNLYPLINGQRDPREATINRLVTRNVGQYPQQLMNVGYNAEWKLSSVDLYSFATYSWRRSHLGFTFRGPTNLNDIPQVYANGFAPQNKISEQDYQAVVGAKGTVAGWDWDLSTSYGQNRARQNESDTINASLGPASPTDFYIGSLTSTEWINSLDITRGFAVGENLQVSAGVQHRLEQYRIGAGEPLSYAAGTYVIPAGQPFAGKRPAPGAQGTSGFTPDDAGSASRNNLAAYAEVTYDATPNLTMDFAGRAEHFDDSSGNTVVGEASGRYQFAPWIAVRGAASTGFRAPALAQQLYATTTGQFRTLDGVINLLQIKTLPVGSPAAVALGAVPLKPEKSKDLSAGIVLQPAANFTTTVDVYQIKVDKRIALTGTLTGPVISGILVANGLPPDISAQYYTNAINTKTKGIDVVSEYMWDLGDWGSMRLSAGFNYTKTSITHVIPNPPALSALGPGFVVFDRRVRLAMTEGLPKSKLFLTDVWKFGKMTLSPRLSHYASYLLPSLQPSDDRRISGAWVVDFEADYQLTPNISLALGANNLFNKYPRIPNETFNPTLGPRRYDTASPYGFTGAAYYARIAATF